MKNTLLINLYGGPCAGKSTICAGLFYELKKRGYDCEMVLEFAKEKVWDEAYKVLEDQIYLFGKQYHKIKRLWGKVDIIISDSPLPLCIYYNKENNEAFNNLVIQELNKFNHVDYFITRGTEYNENGRLQTLEEAKEIDNGVVELLKKYNIRVKTVPQEFAIKNILNTIE